MKKYLFLLVPFLWILPVVLTFLFKPDIFYFVYKITLIGAIITVGLSIKNSLERFLVYLICVDEEESKKETIK